MKICFVTFGNFKGHSTLKRATGMALPLQVAGHSVTLLLEDSPDNREKVELECPGTPVVWHKRARWFAPERLAKQKAIQSLQPDLVWICGVGARNWITHHGHNAIILADHSELYSVVMPKAYQRLCFRLLEYFYMSAFDGHICASRYLFNHYSKALERKGCTSLVHHSPYAYHESALIVPTRKGLNTKKSVLYLGSFWENYGFWDMLHAIKILRSQRSDFTATFIGRGPEADRGKEWVETNHLEDTIIFPGYVDDRDLGRYMADANAFLSPMRDTIQDWARCPSKQYLYLPFKRPVITAKIGESIEVFGTNGYYYEPKNISSLAKAIERSLDEPEAFTYPNPNDHTFTARTRCFLDWFFSTWSQHEHSSDSFRTHPVL